MGITAINIKFKEGNTRSLAMALIKEYGNEKAWELARQIEKEFGKDFNTEQVNKFLLDNSDDSVIPAENTVEEESASVTTEKDPIISSEKAVEEKLTPTADTKNGKMREMLLEGKSVVEIRNMFSDLTYQRVKNVQKDMIRKGLLAV